MVDPNPPSESSPPQAEAPGVDRVRTGLAGLDQAVPVAVRERYLRRLGALLLVLGPIWIAVEYFVSHSTRSPLQQGDAIVGSLFGLSLMIAGAALFVRYSGGRLWRYGIARMTYDQQILSDRVVDAMERRRRPLERAAPGRRGSDRDGHVGAFGSRPQLTAPHVRRHHSRRRRLDR